MRSKLPLLFLCCIGSVLGRDVVAVVTGVTYKPIPGVPLTERLDREEKNTSFLIAPESSKAAPFDGPHGGSLSPTSQYSIKKSKSGNAELCDGETHFGPALNILFQCKLDERDFVIVRREHNSFSSPIRWFAALSGHPVQVSEIWAVIIDGSNDPKEIELLSKPATYEWKARLFEKEPGQALPPTASSGRGTF